MAENEVHVRITSDSDIVDARSRGRTLAVELGFSSGDITLIATAMMTDYTGKDISGEYAQR